MELLQAYNSWPKYSNKSCVPQSYVSLCMLPQGHDLGLACLGRRRRRRGVPLPLLMLQLRGRDGCLHHSNTKHTVLRAGCSQHWTGCLQPHNQAGWPPKLLS